MAVEDVLPAILLIGLLYLFLRWLSKPSPPAPGGRDDAIPGVTSAMVETVHSAFPNVPTPNIIHHLSKTRSEQATSEEILERGSLPPPPASFHIPASLQPATVDPSPASPTAPASSIASPGKKGPTTAQSLIERYGLKARVPSRKGKERDPDMSTGPDGGQDIDARRTGGKWEDTKEKRERELRDRKERMILDARRRMLEKQAKDEGVAL